MISIGGIIGAGVFVGSSAAIATIGPAVILSYLSAGIVVYAVIRILARMAMDQPGLGSFTEYVRAGLGNGAGFIAGWLYWWFWVVVVAIEAIAGAQTIHAWLPMFDVWQIGLGLMALLTAVNLTSARSYGEFEFWFASIKVAAIVVFIVVAASWLLGVGNPSSPGLTNLTAHQGFAPFGWAAILAGVTTVIFSMVGAEIVTVAAAESAESNTHHVAAGRHRRAAHPAVLRALDRADPVHRAVDAVQVRRFLVRAGAASASAFRARRRS